MSEPNPSLGPSDPDPPKAAGERSPVQQRILELANERSTRSAAELLPLIYDELRKTAAARIRRLEPGQTLQATALVHEAWMRVVGEADPGWDCRSHFFGAAAQAMRNILVDAARRRQAYKRGGDKKRETADRLLDVAADLPSHDLLELHEILEELEERDSLKARIVSLRFFTGMTVAEVAEVLELSKSRVESEWRFARSWLQTRLSPDGGTP